MVETVMVGSNGQGSESKILLLQPDDAVRNRLAELLSEARSGTILTAETIDEANEHLECEAVDVLVIAQDLDDHEARDDGLALVETWRAEGVVLPIVLTVKDGDESTVARAVDADVDGLVPMADDVETTVLGIVETLDGIDSEPGSTAALRRRWERVEALHDVALGFERCRTTDDAFERAVDGMAAVLDVDTCVLYVAEGGELVPKATVGDLLGGWEPYGLEEGVTGKTYLTGESFRVDRIQSDSSAAPASTDFQSGISVPIGSFGVLQAISTEPAAFTDHDLKLVEFLAAHVTATVSRIVSERALRTERDQLANLFENVPDAVAITTSEDQRVREVNPAFEATFGFDRDAIVRRPINEVLVPADAEPIHPADLDDAITTEVRRRTADGVRDFLFRGFAVESEDGVREYGIYTDITDRKAREARIWDLHDGTRRLMAAAGADAVAEIVTDVVASALCHPINTVYRYRADVGGLVPVAVSERARAVFGEPPTIPAGHGLVWEAYETGEGRTNVNLTNDTDGVTPDSPVRSEAYVPLGDHGVLVMAADEVDAFDEETVALANVLGSNVEAALDRAERERTLADRTRELERQNDRLERFASSVSHDLRNPLTVAAGRVDLARELAVDGPAGRVTTDGSADGPTDSDQLAGRHAPGNDDDTDTLPIEELVSHLTEIEWAIERMETLVDDVLELARSGQRLVETEPVDLESVVATARRSVNGDLEVVVENDLGTVEGNEQRLLALFENCLRNALEHAGPGTTVTISRTDEGFAIADDGPGIDPDDRDAVLETGYTTAETGTGFGLAIVTDVVEVHGWSLSIEESEAGGAKIHVQFDEVEDRPTDTDASVIGQPGRSP